jgi:hypothetical protein
MPSTRGLHPQFRPVADELLRAARALDPRFVITSAKRSRTDQARLYARYVKGESPFTALPPGRSQHERGFAIDMVRLGVDAAGDELLAELGRAWRAVGGVWGGEKDPVHFEAPKRWTGRG